jgi:modulator of FtsH protease HflK
LIDTVFLKIASYKENMEENDKDSVPGEQPDELKGPWDASKAAGKSKGKSALPNPDINPDERPGEDSETRANPWNMDGKKPKESRDKSGGFEEFLRRAGRTGGNDGGQGWSNLSFGDGNLKIWPKVLIGFAAVWVLWSSIHRIDPGEAGVVTRLGKYARTVDSGISLTLPAPLERMYTVDTQQLRYSMVGSPQSSDENLVLTKDQNLIDLAYQVAWNVRDPEKFLFQLEEAEIENRDTTVKSVAESAMRATIANYGYDEAVGPSRLDIEVTVRQRMQAILDQYGSGIRIHSISIKQSDPPEQTKEAFNKVTAAQQERESNLSKARAYAAQVKQRAEGDTGEFDRIFVQYKAAPEVTKRRLYYETMESILGNVDKTIVEAGNVQPYLPLPELKKRVADAAEQSKAKEAAQ